MIKLAAPNLGENELNAIKKVFDSNILVHGNEVINFENKTREYLNVKEAMAVSSGTAALHLALLALGIGDGDEVIVPSFSFPATWNVVELVGAKCIFVDIKIDDFNIDEYKIEQLISDRTKAIICVQEFGQSSDMDIIKKIAIKYNLFVIEDAACSFGAKYKEVSVGTIGDIGCYSFHPRKNITTGEGGLVVTNDSRLAEKIRILRNHGIINDSGKFDFILPGLNYRMTNIQGAIANVQIKNIEENYTRRSNIAAKYSHGLKSIKEVILPKELKHRKHIWQSYSIILESKKIRDDLKKYLLVNGIESNFGAYSFSELTYYKNRYYIEDSYCLNSRRAYETTLCIPIHNNLTDDEVNTVINTIREFFEEYEEDKFC